MGASNSTIENYSFKDETLEEYKKRIQSEIYKDVWESIYEENKDIIEKNEAIKKENNEKSNEHFEKYFNSEKKRLTHKIECLENIFKLWNLIFIQKNSLDATDKNDRNFFLAKINPENRISEDCKEYAKEFFQNVFDDIDFSSNSDGKKKRKQVTKNKSIKRKRKSIRRKIKQRK